MIKLISIFDLPESTDEINTPKYSPVSSKHYLGLERSYIFNLINEFKSRLGRDLTFDETSDHVNRLGKIYRELYWRQFKDDPLTIIVEN